MDKILVPFDFSTPSKNAFRFAVDIASKTGAEIILLYVFYISPMNETMYLKGLGSNLDYDFIQEIRDSIMKDLDTFLGNEANTNVKTKIVSTNGKIVNTILEKIKELNIDLVIMGKSGIDGIDEFFFGSITKKTIRKSTVPVMAIQKPTEVTKIKHILLPSNLEKGQENFITHLKGIQELFNAKLHLLLINTPMHFQPETEAWKELKEFAKHHQLTNYESHFTSHWTEEKGILEFQKSNKTDMIAMSTHGRTGFSHAFYGSITEDIVSQSGCPIWTYCLNE
ncbi:universal stress protein [Echinicola shivajiensis]|uniref:universal stress protein n=1 Tax=Echinicola shivajiensis TaxID=1035916 RepID=UPI001BFC2203|nr:universal stress protein [Echinicola shivajiensis]